MKNNVMRNIRMFLFTIVIGLYTTFVVQHLWNWFMVPSFHVAQASYWLIYGLILLYYQLTYHAPLEENQRWKKMMVALEACIPEDRKAEVDVQLEMQDEHDLTEFGFSLFGQLFGNTVSLGIGWTVHTFLA